MIRKSHCRQMPSLLFGFEMSYKNLLAGFCMVQRAIPPQCPSIRQGDDAINFFAQYGANSPIKFVHLVRANKGSQVFCPYDLVVANPRECGSEYFIMSSGEERQTKPRVDISPEVVRGRCGKDFFLRKWSIVLVPPYASIVERHRTFLCRTFVASGASFR